jgi:hypothetical protein
MANNSGVLLTSHKCTAGNRGAMLGSGKRLTQKGKSGGSPSAMVNCLGYLIRVINRDYHDLIIFDFKD